MRTPERSYQCSVCRWQGRAEPLEESGAAPCPQCGVYLYPLPWAQTWGVALALIGVTLALILAAARILPGF